MSVPVKPQSPKIVESEDGSEFEIRFPELPVEDQLTQIISHAEKHERELAALEAAEGGDADDLAQIIEEKGRLGTVEAREYVSARLQGVPSKRGVKATEAKVIQRLQLFVDVTDLMIRYQLNQSQAIRKYMDEALDFPTSFDSVRSEFQLGRDQFFKLCETLGIEIVPLVGKS